MATNGVNHAKEETHTKSQRYLSTRGAGPQDDEQNVRTLGKISEDDGNDIAANIR